MTEHPPIVSNWRALFEPGELLLLHPAELTILSEACPGNEYATISHMLETEAAGGIVLNARGEVAVVSTHDDFWSLPKGHIDQGEDALSAAKREICEETGLTRLTLIREFSTYQRYRGTSSGGDDTEELKTFHMFLFTTDEETLAPQDTYNPEARWVKQSNVETLLTHPKDKEFFRGADLTR